MKNFTSSNLEIRDLFVSHIMSTIALKCVYVKLNITDDGTIISYGADESAIDDILPNSQGSYLIFDELDADFISKDVCAVKLEELQSTLQKNFPSRLVFTMSEDKKELLIEAKTEVSVPENPAEPQVSSCELFDYLYTHRRTILAVEKDHLHLTNVVLAFIMTDVCGLYAFDEKFYCEISDEYPVKLEEIMSLDRSTFDVYILNENCEAIVFEITNKLLQRQSKT